MTSNIDQLVEQAKDEFLAEQAIIDPGLEQLGLLETDLIITTKLPQSIVRDFMLHDAYKRLKKYG